MVAQLILSAALLSLASTAFANTTSVRKGDYVNWRKFHANGVNLGGWLAQEILIDPYWRDNYCRGHDKLASGDVNLIRIPTGTTYAAWVKIPGAGYHSGNQQKYFKQVADYAIKTYGMHVALDLHSLPGGVNGLDIGERVGHWDWFNSTKNLDLSLKVVDTAVSFIQNSGSPQSYSFAPINEPADNPDFSKFGQPAAHSDAGADWVLKYFKAVLEHVKSINCKILVLLQGSFKGEPFWSPKFDKSENIAFDVHNYYFGRPNNSDNFTSLLCADAKTLTGDGKFPVFVGEWSIQTSVNNQLANRARNVNTGLYSYNKYTQGNAYWTAKFRGNVSVVGEGTTSEYWNYESFIDLGILDEKQGKQYCS
ncbi:glycoside hydrolase family 5 protein [Didymella exigua CBS 183.55]|uniref:glucan 1,3-beta-glucosidase n=1 Tax=Didymella exigua CBS 183.55 TaxID=1150837 RepID=A0A6A5S0D0_9PLEO|nr:glycoside hydrolase family 5 protein [Didymella exigua CBS 183.55]KAF1933303.1 glycoside hydrolase family 5 protein [Didymella exigua CBS 183.55]